MKRREMRRPRDVLQRQVLAQTRTDVVHRPADPLPVVQSRCFIRGVHARHPTVPESGLEW